MRREGIGLLVLLIVGLVFLFTGCAQKKPVEGIQSSTQNEMKAGDQPSGTDQFSLEGGGG